MSCSIGGRHSSDPTLLWLWRRPAATAPIRPLAWEHPFAAGAALEKAKDKKKKKKRKEKEKEKKRNNHTASGRGLVPPQGRYRTLSLSPSAELKHLKELLKHSAFQKEGGPPRTSPGARKHQLCRRMKAGIATADSHLRPFFLRPNYKTTS